LKSSIGAFSSLFHPAAAACTFRALTRVRDARIDERTRRDRTTSLDEEDEEEDEDEDTDEDDERANAHGRSRTVERVVEASERASD